MKLRVVADTNIYISALMFGGIPGIFLELAMRQAFILITSSQLLDELDEKLRGKFRVASADASAIRSKLESIAILAQPKFTLSVIADDPDDNRVLECAVAGQADAIVSGDRHLLRIGTHNAIRILTTRQFLDSTGIHG